MNISVLHFQNIDNITIQNKGPLSQIILSKGITSLHQVLRFLQALPYGRNSDRSDFSLVIKEAKGSCSSKHAFLKSLLDEQSIACQLQMIIYKMNGDNTPGVDEVLRQYNMSHIPEAHCFVTIQGQAVDITKINSDIHKILESVLETYEISPADVVYDKVKQHKLFITRWLEANFQELSFEKVWQIREACIKALSE